jgi:hypothetical protein
MSHLCSDQVCKKIGRSMQKKSAQVCKKVTEKKIKIAEVCKNFFKNRVDSLFVFFTKKSSILVFSATIKILFDQNKLHRKKNKSKRLDKKIKVSQVDF